MILREIKSYPIFSEFDPQQQIYFFDFSRDKVLPHIDTLYYGVTIKGDSNENVLVKEIIETLKELKQQKYDNRSSVVWFEGLTVEIGSHSIYTLRLSCGEDYDIFFSPCHPNDDTPRIMVQIRSRSLVLNGVMQSVCKSFAWIENFLEIHGLSVSCVRENRVDFAYHTNLIQNPYKFFSDDMLLQHMRSTMSVCRSYGKMVDNDYDDSVFIDKIKKIQGSKMDISYFSIGSQRSNNIFIRIYNKSREVVEMNYKSFFLDRWLDNKLINRYDHYVYQKAFKYKSYRVGVLRGRLEWYLEYGSNEAIKRELKEVNESCVINSNNVKHLEEVVERYLPPVTLIMNIEFQCMRKFFYNCSEMIDDWGVPLDDCLKYIRSDYFSEKYNPLRRLQSIYSLRSVFCHYLTTKVLRFVKDKSVKMSEEEYLNWWNRVHQSTLDDYNKRDVDFYRLKEMRIDKERAKRTLLNAVARLTSLNQKSTAKTGFVEDLGDALCTLNDNDFVEFRPMVCYPDTGECIDFSLEKDDEYRLFKKRQRQRINQIYNSKEKVFKDFKENNIQSEV